MRNARIIVVFACIRLSYEFILPLGILELVDKSSLKLKNNNEEEIFQTASENDNVKLIVSPSKGNKNKLKGLENSQNRIEENELYDQSNGRESNVNERSFIFINQKFRTPLLSQLYGPEFLTHSTSVMGHERTINRILENNPMVYLNSKKSYFPEKLQVKDSSQSFAKYKKIHVIPEVLDKMKIINGMSSTAPKMIKDLETTQYVELLKPPILRPTNYVTIKKGTTWQNVQPITYSKYEKDNNRYSFMSYDSDYLQKSSINPVIYEPDNNGVPSPFGQRSNKPEEIESLSNSNNWKSEYSNKVIQPAEKNNTNIIIKKILSDNNEVNKLLDRYLTDSLIQSGSNEQSSEQFECSHNECNVKSKVEVVNRLMNGNDCKCGHHRFNVSVRESSDFENVNSGKKVATMTEVDSSSKSSEVLDYGDMTSEEANIVKAVKELVPAINSVGNVEELNIRRNHFL